MCFAQRFRSCHHQLEWSKTQPTSLVMWWFSAWWFETVCIFHFFRDDTNIDSNLSNGKTHHQPIFACFLVIVRKKTTYRFVETEKLGLWQFGGSEEFQEHSQQDAWLALSKHDLFTLDPCCDNKNRCINFLGLFEVLFFYLLDKPWLLGFFCFFRCLKQIQDDVAICFHLTNPGICVEFLKKCWSKVGRDLIAKKSGMNIRATPLGVTSFDFKQVRILRSPESKTSNFLENSILKKVLNKHPEKTYWTLLNKHFEKAYWTHNFKQNNMTVRLDSPSSLARFF